MALASTSESMPCASGVDDRHSPLGQYVSAGTAERGSCCPSAAEQSTLVANTKTAAVARFTCMRSLTVKHLNGRSLDRTRMPDTAEQPLRYYHGRHQTQDWLGRKCGPEVPADSSSPREQPARSAERMPAGPLSVCPEIPKSAAYPPSQTQAVLGRISFGTDFPSSVGDEQTTPLYPTRRCPRRGHLPHHPQPFPPSARPGARRDHRRRPGAGPEPLQDAHLRLRVRLLPLPPPPRRRRRLPAQPVHVLRGLERRPGSRPALSLAREILVTAVPGHRGEQRGGGPDRAAEVRPRER